MDVPWGVEDSVTIVRFGQASTSTACPTAGKSTGAEITTAPKQRIAEKKELANGNACALADVELGVHNPNTKESRNVSQESVDDVNS
jgi:hypothetical protein